MQEQVTDKLLRVAQDCDDITQAVHDVLIADENTDIELTDGTKTPSLSKRVKQFGGQVTSVAGLVGDITAQDITNELELGTAAQYAVEDLPKNDKASQIFDESGLSQQEVNNDLYIYKKPVVYAAKIKTDGTDQLQELNALALEASSKKLELVLPSGVVTISDEFIPPNGLKLTGQNSTATWATGHSGTVLKWGGGSGANKAVLRCSRSPIGVTPTSQINAVEIDGIMIDSDGCDYGAYFRYFTNESRVKNLVVRNSTKCNIWGGQLWFSWFDQLTSVGAQDKGIVFGVPLSGETGDLAVNGINFPYIRAHSSGKANTYDEASNPTGGCGFMFNTQSCTYGLIQSELNGGVGVINKSISRANAFTNIYLENNCGTSSSELKTSYIQDTGSSGTPCTLHSITLATKQVVVNNNTAAPLFIGDLNAIDRTYQCLNGVANSAGFSFFGFESPALEGMSADEQARLIKCNTSSKWFANNVNLRYTSQISNANFRVTNSSEYVALFIIPTTTATGSFTFTMNFAGTTFTYTVTDPVAGQAYRVRRPTLTKGSYRLVLNAGTTADFNVDIVVASGVYQNGRSARYFTI